MYSFPENLLRLHHSDKSNSELSCCPDLDLVPGVPNTAELTYMLAAPLGTADQVLSRCLWSRHFYRPQQAHFLWEHAALVSVSVSQTGSAQSPYIQCDSPLCMYLVYSRAVILVPGRLDVFCMAVHCERAPAGPCGRCGASSGTGPV